MHYSSIIYYVVGISAAEFGSISSRKASKFWPICLV